MKRVVRIVGNLSWIIRKYRIIWAGCLLDTTKRSVKE